MISVNHVSKRYNKRDMVVDDVSFTVEKGRIFGLLGPNGAGKTTLMQMIATLLEPTSGIVSICGLDTKASAQEIRKKIGFLTTEIKLDPLSTPNQLFDFFSELYDIPKEKIASHKQESFARFGIEPFANKRIAELSTGMKQKISIVISLIHDPQVIIFDEPTNGLDILTSRQVMDYLLELREKGCCVLLSTHIFSVAEQLCDEIAILVDGKIVDQGSAKELAEKTGSKTFEEAFFKLYSEHHREG
ncbi:MAG: ABC transporter ATP-binding protein [Clostridiales bacterium]|nr:ABC transporter ATP-binding protein [Clostridiales bacterium]MBR5936698.1 ABC transporter ATP-binding protein [Clostridiales bacterium]